MRVLARCVLALTWLALPRSAISGPASELPAGHIKARSFTSVDGLRSTAVTSIAQDEHGALWLGGDDGVDRFDGERFRHFGPDDGLAAGPVSALAIAPDGTLCAGGLAGLRCSDGASFSRALTAELAEVPVHALVAHADALWVGAASGLYVRDGSGTFHRAPGWPEPADQPVRALWADETGLVVAGATAIWLGAGNGSWRSLGENGALGLDREPIEGVLRDRTGAVWLRSASHVWQVPPGAEGARDVRDGLPLGADRTRDVGDGRPLGADHARDVRDGLPPGADHARDVGDGLPPGADHAHDVRDGLPMGGAAMAIDPRGRVVLATDDGVAYRDGDRWSVVGPALGLPGGPIHALFVDREHTLWLGGAGLVQLRGRGVVEHDGPDTGLTGYVAWAFHRDPQGTLWIGTDHCLARGVAGRWVCLRGTDGYSVRRMVFPRQGGVFLAGAPSDRRRHLEPLEPAEAGAPSDRRRRREPLEPAEAGAPSDRRRRLEPLRPDEASAPLDRGQRRREPLEPAEAIAARHLHIEQQQVGAPPLELLYIDAGGHAISVGDLGAEAGVRDLAIGPDGDLYVATGRGLFRLPGARPGSLERVTIPETPGAASMGSLVVVGDQLWTAPAGAGVAVLEHGQWRVFSRRTALRAQTLSYLAARADGRMCAAYAAAPGVTCFRYDGHIARNFEHLEVGGTVAFLGEDPAGRLWVGTDAAIDVLSDAGADRFDDSDGLAGHRAAAQAFFVDHDGSLWLGSHGGATHVLAQFYSGPPTPPRIAFAGQLGATAIPAPGLLKVSHDRGALSVVLEASSLLDARRLTYQARLSPLETAWSDTDQRQARYPALLPGSYQLEARARIGRGSWGPTSALRFTVLPAWWQTRWFIALAGLGALTVAAASLAWLLRALLRRRLQRLQELAPLISRTG